MRSNSVISISGLQSAIYASIPIVTQTPSPNTEESWVKYSVEDTWLYTVVWDDENTFSGELSDCLTALANVPGVEYSEILQAWSKAHYYGEFENHNFWIAHISHRGT
ncbi:hypothetical protein [Chroococcidiopsis sp. CCMEE 29]|uniref:hypothetical protein n=1 Tax=Chroococcidiopsis sp. CCMEE 29 TaxID=155894 RepID=UPI00202277F0|nr:hypothetical protein [Chroococcidiopsis sp. CCMEE 29]